MLGNENHKMIFRIWPNNKAELLQLYLLIATRFRHLAHDKSIAVSLKEKCLLNLRLKLLNNDYVRQI